MSSQSSSLSNGFIELPDTDSLDRFLAEANGSPAIIFKHSNSCGISARAHGQMSKVERPVGLVIVQRARALSDEIAARTCVEHETPQVFILRGREVLWTASHGQIRAEAVEAALIEASRQAALSRTQESPVFEATQKRQALERQAIEPREISQESNTHLRITWGDERVCNYDAAALRRVCPCAQCVNEWTGQRTLRPDAVSDEVEINDLSIVGRYALNFRWSDGHETGIYSFQYLRDLCEH